MIIWYQYVKDLQVYTQMNPSLIRSNLDLYLF